MSATDCWAVGWSGGSGLYQTLTEHYNGSSWAVVGSPNVDTANYLSAVTCVSSIDCWAVGYYNGATANKTLIEQYNGAGWAVVTSVNPGIPADFGGVTCNNASDCWAVGAYCCVSGLNQTLIEHYDGASWSQVSSPSPGTTDDGLGTVNCTSSTNCWATGGYSGGTLFEQYNGTTWSVVGNNGINVGIGGATCVSASDCWAVGDFFSVTTNSYQTSIVQYNGSTWNAVISPNRGLLNNFLHSVSCVSATYCWAVGQYDNETLTEQYNGTGWSVVPSPSPGSVSEFSGVTCVSTSNCWAVGDSVVSGFTQALTEQYTGSAWVLALAQQQPVGGAVALSEIAGGTNCACASADLAQAYSGDPVGTAYGNFTETTTDLSIPGRGIPLQFSRTYNSQLASSNGSLGFGWTSNIFISLSQPGGTGPVTITQEGGAQVVFLQSGSIYTPALPRVTATLVQNGDGTWTFVRGGQNTSTFSATGKLLNEKDRNGSLTGFAYNGSQQLTTITDPAGRTLSIGWTGNNITSLTDPNISPNRTVTYQYNDGNGNLTDVIDANGGHTHFAYDSSHHLTNLFDPNCYAAGSACDGGNGVVNGYDTQGRISSQKDQLGRQTTFLLVGDPSSAAGSTTTITNPKGNVTVDTYQYGLLTAQTRGYGSSAAATYRYTYDLTTVALVSTLDPNGHLTTFAVDANGNQLNKIDPLDRETKAYYNSFNEPLGQTDGLNVKTSYTYDANGNLQTVSRPLLNSSGQVVATRTTQYNYNDASHPGDITSMVDPDNNTWNYGYDAYGNRISTGDPLGNTATTTFNADGWKLTSVSPRGNVSGCNCASQYTTTYGYVDTVSGKTYQYGDVATVTDPLGHVSANHYDGDRNLTSNTDANGNPTSSTFDLANEQTVTTRADLTTLRTDYNGDGTVADQKDGKGNATVSFGYDALARVTSQTDALGNITSFSYDGVGNTLTQQDPGGNCLGMPATGCTTRSYDADNELTGIAYSDGITPNVTGVSYDSVGERLAMTDGTGTSHWTWDSLYRLTNFADGHADQVGYRYNLRGLITQILYPSGNVIRGYDIAGRWTSVQDWLSNTTTFGYDPDGNLTSKTLPTGTGVVDTTVFNAAEQLTSISDVKASTTLFSAVYGRDNSGQVSSDSSLPSTVGADRYTSLNQLCYAGSNNSASCSSPPSGSQAYSFDSADNLIGNKGNAQAFNAADELCWGLPGNSSNSCSNPPTGATQYGYNTRGDRTTATPPAGSATNMGYDQANRLTSWSQGSVTAAYSYNGDGLRMSKTVSSATTVFTWDISGKQPLLITDGTSSYIYGPGRVPVEQITSRAAISRIGTGTASGKSSTLRITLPSGSKANDQVFVASTQPSTTTVTAPSGYTLVASVTSGGSSPLATTAVFRHTVATGDTSVTLTYSTSTTAQSAALAVYRGIDPSVPVDVMATGSAAATTSVTAPSITPLYANEQLVVFHGAIGTFSGSSWTAPSGMTERAQVNNTANTSTGLADQALGGAGASGTRTSTYGKSANLTTIMLAAPQPPTVLFYHGDQLGSTRVLTDIVGVVRGTSTYDPYGNLTGSTGSYTTPFGFAAEYRDTESGLIYLRARSYDPVTSQFLSCDPATPATGAPYQYVSGDPLNTTDPSGLYPRWLEPDASGDYWLNLSHAGGSSPLVYSGQIPTPRGGKSMVYKVSYYLDGNYAGSRTGQTNAYGASYVVGQIPCQPGGWQVRARGQGIDVTSNIVVVGSCDDPHREPNPGNATQPQNAPWWLLILGGAAAILSSPFQGKARPASAVSCRNGISLV